MEQVQLWSDSVYMVPPFLAYYGVDGQTGVWRHVVEGSWEDEGCWATGMCPARFRSRSCLHFVLLGNGWATMGMLRVIQTIAHSPFASEMEKEQRDLTSWVEQIIKGMIPYQQNNGAFRNYLDNPDTFTDSSSTAFFAASVYRLAALSPDASRYIPAADKARQWVSSDLGGDGWLKNVVNPYNFGEKGSRSPEGQAFVLMMEAAYRDLQAGGFQ